MHSKKAVPSSSDTIPPSSGSSPVYAVVTRGCGPRGKQKAVEYPRIFNYEKNAVARQLRDEGMKELAERAN